MDRAVVGVEALLRWPHPERGLIQPDVVIPMAERAGLILALGTWVLHRACEDFVRWRSTYGDALAYVAVNVSAHQVVSPSFAQTITDVLDDTGMDPTRLHLEVTESVTLDDPTRVRAVMNELKQVGVHFSLDDFGMGYSCLSYLRVLPFDSVKIDRSFVAGLTGPDATTRAIIEMIIGLGRALRLPVVAEGIETAKQLTEVIALGATFAQGYLLGPPLFAVDLERQILDLPKAS
jgi:EAL domain-containing protein (putative c-di-GMP-specific phosphodiesterase class I)